METCREVVENMQMWHGLVVAFAVLGAQLDSKILEAFSNLKGPALSLSISMVLRH